MKKLISWICVISLLLLLLFYAVSASGAENNAVLPSAADAYATIEHARNMVINTDDGLEKLVREGTGLLSQGQAWEPLARKKLRIAAEKAVEIEKLLAPFLPPHGVSALRFMNLGPGDRVLQNIEFASYTYDFSSELPSQKVPARGEIIGGPRLENEKLFWLVRFSADTEGWLPENVLVKEFPHHPLLIAAACWIQGNTVTYKMLALLRSYQEDELTGERNGTIKDMLGSIISAYECALGMYSTPESIASLGVNEAARRREIIKKNFPIMQEQQKQSQKKSADGRVGPQDETDMIRAILGDENAKDKKGKQSIMIPIPQREGDPERKYTPGVPVGIH